MRNFSRFLASRDVFKQKSLYNIRQAKALLEPTGRKAIARPAVKKETAVFPRDMSDSLPPYVSQDPMTPGLVDLERKKVAYLRRKDEVAAGIEGKIPKAAKAGEADKEVFQEYLKSKGHVADVLGFSGVGYNREAVRQVVEAVEELNKRYSEAGNHFNYIGSISELREHAARVGNKDVESWAKNTREATEKAKIQAKVNDEARAAGKEVALQDEAAAQYSAGAGFIKYEDTRGIAIDDDLLKMSPEEIKQDLIRQRNDKWTVPGSDTLKSVVDHEFGHSLDDVLKLREDKEIKKLFIGEKGQYWDKPRNTINTASDIKKELENMRIIEDRTPYIKENLSDYGSTNIKEFIAEGLSEYWNTDKPRFLAKRIGEITDKRYADYVAELKKRS